MTEASLEAVSRAPRLAIISDVDGTLTPIRPTPEEVTLDPDVIGMLVALALTDGVEVVVASGRPREFLVEWFEHAPAITLSAEHGSWLREDGAWRRTVEADLRQLEALVGSLRALAAEEPGLRVEPKSQSCAVHVRAVPPDRRARTIERLDVVVERFVHDHPAWASIRGHEVVEVRPRGASKASVVHRARARGAGPILVLGDDVTDEDMFRELGAEDLGVLVSTDPRRATAATGRVDTPADVKRILDWLLAARTHGDAGPPPRLAPTTRRS